MANDSPDDPNHPCDCKCCPGAQGPQGIPGSAGPQGIQGIPGQQGMQGPKGDEGPRGPQGQDGMQGPMGFQGPQGAQGQDGPQGIPGEAGAQGPVGPMGLQGPQGIQGDCVNCKPEASSAIEYAEVYSKLSQVLSPSPGPDLPGQVCLLENVIVATSNIDVSQSGISGEIQINRAGWYDVATGICAGINPLPTPLPVWTLSLFKNGVLVPGSTFANMTLSPDQLSNEIVADVFVHFDAGDKFSLNNTSSNPINVNAPSIGTQALPSSAYLKVILLEAD